MKNIATLIFILKISIGFAQSISNVVGIQQGNNAIITYDLNGAATAAYYIRLYYSIDGGKTFSDELTQVTGDIKGGIKPASNKKIIWLTEKEVNSLNTSVVFKVEAEEKKSLPKPIVIQNATLELLDVKRNGEQVTVEFSFIHNGDEENREYALQGNGKTQLTGLSGKQYNPTHTMLAAKNDTRGGDIYNVDCIKDVPIRGSLIFNLDENDLVIPAIKISMYASKTGIIEYIFKNLPIE